MSLSDLSVQFHLVFEIMAFYFGVAYYFRLRKGQVEFLTERQKLVLILSACIGALALSRLLAWIEHYNLFFCNFSWWFLLESKTIYGGIVGGWIAIEIAKKFLKIRRSTGDIFVYPLILGIMIGRVGCAIAGVNDGTAGLPSNLPWAYGQGDGIPRHPVAVYEIICMGLLWLFLKSLKANYELREGDIFKLFMISYSLWRFFVEFLKPVTPLAFGLSTIQISCIIVLLFYTFIFIKRIPGKSNHA